MLAHTIMLEYRLIFMVRTCNDISMSSETTGVMARTRALLTATDRDYITGDEGRERRYQSASRIRSRIQEELPKDIELLEEHHPELLQELREVVCPE